MSKKIKCQRCKINKAYPEDMENRACNLLLCDDCYTEIRYLLADYLDIHIQDIKIWLVAPINYMCYNRCRNIMNRIKPISRIPNPVAKKLLDTRYRQRIVKNKKRYDRKREQNVYDRTV
jgi:hypothetical protein